MVKSVLGVNHQGLRDWAIQRASAIVMAVYSIWFVAFLVMHPDLSYLHWHVLFSQFCVKIATLLFILSLLFHAWIGMWTIFTDYIKWPVLRAILNFFVILMLIVSFLWACLIVGSV